MDLVLHYNSTTKTVKVKDSSFRYRAMMLEDYLSVEFALAEFVDFPIGTYCTFDGTTYTLEQPASFAKNGNRNFDYKLTMYAPYYRGNKYKFRNTADGRLKFDITATPSQLLTMLVANLNQRDSGWAVGSCITADAKLIEFNHSYCLEALKSIADEFETEYHISGKTIYLGKVEYNKSNPLALQYMTNVKPALGRENYDTTLAVERLYVQGGEQNIDYSKYGNQCLLLPKSKAITYEGITYASDSQGLYIERSGLTAVTHNEDSLDCSEYYPKRIGTVSSVVTVDAEKNEYDIIDSSIPASLDYEDCIVTGEQMTIIFQSGMLAGRQFDVKYYHNAVGEKAARRFEIVPLEEDGYTFPCAGWLPAVGDTYIVYGVQVPNAYIQDDDTQTGAAYNMFRAAAKYLYEHENPQFSFTGEIDPTWSRANWETYGAKFIVGGYVNLTDTQFLPSGQLIRIVGVKQYLNYPYEPEVEISNKVCGQGLVSSELRKIGRDEVAIDSSHKESVKYTKRRFRDVNETAEMLEEALDSLSEQWTNGISPITARTMQMRVGDEALQFQFVNASGAAVDDGITWSDDDNQLQFDGGIIKHYTLGIDTVKPQRAEADYKKWTIDAAELTPTADDAKYYIYAQCDKVGSTGELILSATALDLDDGTDYNLLVGILNSVYEETRSIARLYGYTEVLPGQVTAYKYLSPDGFQVLDFLNKTFCLGDAAKYLKMDTENGIIEAKNLVFRSRAGSSTFPAPVYKGAWAAGTYYRGETVTHSGTTYMCMCDLDESTEAEPPASPWVVYAAKGTDGTSTLIADIDNEMEGVGLDSDGKTVEAISLTTNVSIWSGGTGQSITDLTLTGVPSGWTVTKAQSGGVYTGNIVFSIPTGTSVAENVPITIAVVCALGSRNLTFTVAGIKAGGQGQSAVVYSLLPSVSSVKKDKSGNYSVASVSCAKRKKIGNSDYTVTTDGVLKYSLDGGEEQTYSSAIATTAFTSTLTFIYYLNSIVIDRETIPLIIDGSKGDTGSQGKTLRGPAIWDSTATYRGINGTASTFVDIVMYETSGVYNYYVALKDSTGQIPSASGSEYWQAANEFDFVATKILFSTLAYVERLGVNILKIMSGSNVVGGFMPPSTDGNGNIILWAGGTAANAPFKVNSDGSLSIKGAIEANGSFSGTSGSVTQNYSGKFDNGIYNIGDLLLLAKSGKSVVDIYCDPLKINNNWVADTNELHYSGETAPAVVKHIITISAENYAALQTAGTTDANTLYIVSD